jgi:phosphoglycerate dehydrogenase-like enzyme
MAFSFVLWSAKRLGDFRELQRVHEWNKLKLESLSDKTLLIMGLGAIGSHVAAFGKAFGMRVLGIRRSTAAVLNVDRQGTLADLAAFLPADDDLWDVPNLFVTPHIAFSSPLYLKRVGDLWIENLRRYV